MRTSASPPSAVLRNRDGPICGISVGYHRGSGDLGGHVDAQKLGPPHAPIVGKRLRVRHATLEPHRPAAALQGYRRRSGGPVFRNDPDATSARRRSWTRDPRDPGRLSCRRPSSRRDCHSISTNSTRPPSANTAPCGQAASMEATRATPSLSSREARLQRPTGRQSNAPSDRSVVHANARIAPRCVAILGWASVPE